MGNRGKTFLRTIGDGFGAEKSTFLDSTLGRGFSAGDLGRMREERPEGKSDLPMRRLSIGE